MSFSSDLKKFADKTEKNAEKLVRGTALAVFGSVIKRTPVDTGRARGNWQTDVGRMPDGVTERDDKSGAAASKETIINTADFKLGQPIFLINNLPYIRRLEDGSSTQAPAGMVKVTVNEFEREVNRQARKLT